MQQLSDTGMEFATTLDNTNQQTNDPRLEALENEGETCPQKMFVPDARDNCEAVVLKINGGIAYAFDLINRLLAA